MSRIIVADGATATEAGYAVTAYEKLLKWLAIPESFLSREYTVGFADPETHVQGAHGSNFRGEIKVRLTPNDSFNRWVIAHEVGHVIFGQELRLVTPVDRWLAEGFACFFADYGEIRVHGADESKVIRYLRHCQSDLNGTSGSQSMAYHFHLNAGRLIFHMLNWIAQHRSEDFFRILGAYVVQVQPRHLDQTHFIHVISRRFNAPELQRLPAALRQLVNPFSRSGRFGQQFLRDLATDRYHLCGPGS